MALSSTAAPAPEPPVQSEVSSSSAARMDQEEQVLMRLEEALHPLKGALESGSLEVNNVLDLFAREVEWTDLSQRRSVSSELPARLGIATLEWPVAATTKLSGSELAAWRPWPAIFDQIATVEKVALSTVDGTFKGGVETTFTSQHAVRIRGSSRSGSLISARGLLKLDWRQGDAPIVTDGWRIENWRSAPFRGFEVAKAWFEETLSTVVPDEEDRRRARRSLHQEHVIEQLDAGPDFEPPHPSFAAVSHDRHPALSVVDIDADGWDDLYVMPRWGRNLLFRNRRDGTFEEVAQQVGLDIDGGTTCALFVDFDNDGDADAFLGRSLDRSLLLFNEDGRFAERTASASQSSPQRLPKLVTSASAADYDNDGLVDLYLATYAKRLSLLMPLKEALSLDATLPLPDVETLARMRDSERPVTNSWGPANVLLRNQGEGRFRPVNAEAGLEVWRHTYQASWSDYDQDGDADLYLANDYAPNNLFRNRGDGTFEDVTAETGTSDQGFGMGASWGDYDGDGWLDLYVSNMYSKAGTRITRKIAGLDPAFARMARGNTLLRNLSGGTFAVVSGSKAPALLVERAGWSWGNQFVDVDNDGFLDLAVLNGYYTVPAAKSLVPVDT